MTKGTAHVALTRMHFPETIVAGIPFKQQAMEYVPKSLAPGDTSDGWHSLDDLYRHRTILFASLCNYVEKTKCIANMMGAEFESVTFKSWHHHDGTMYEDMFIAGLRTHKGWVTYHCEAEFWDYFNVPEVSRAPEWDGATPNDGLDRLVDEFVCILGEEVTEP